MKYLYAYILSVIIAFTVMCTVRPGEYLFNSVIAAAWPVHVIALISEGSDLR